MGYIVRATANEGNVRIFCAITTDIVEKARQVHNLSPLASAALGRLLSAGSILGLMSKGEKDKITISMNGGGEAGNILVATNSTGNVKGYISNPAVTLPPNEAGKLDVGGAVGKNGVLNIIRDLGLREPYVGQVPIYTGEIGDDLAYYFTVSEQVPSAVSLGVLVNPEDASIKSAGALIIQMMPDAPEMLADVITFRLEEIPPLSTLISEGKTAEDIINLLFDDMDLKIYETIEVNYECDCSRERVEKTLLSIGEAELNKIKEEEESINVECHFCEKEYKFTSDDIDELIKEAKL
ncbi:Hsp33 family molecular chaperone HslO [Clostridium cylindrosporum]|uniref:33 kDa chaperonin n=1 Tax=Clostridium cylindrosporum DSM 605 TaxID=1121307 RepID=A0A0J8G4R6_CLOCY|nr:Hsp33 family molecular chaperone HslO [Clostridium cylindrosporum]KMT22671.1 33 kDa chaperonin [Clostridium cylindrosporum DSM 605]